MPPKRTVSSPLTVRPLNVPDGAFGGSAAKKPAAAAPVTFDPGHDVDALLSWLQVRLPESSSSPPPALCPLAAA